MANRTVSVVLQAEIGNYVSNMTKAAAATKGVGDTAETTATKANKGFDLAGRGAMLFGIAAAGALVGVVAKSMEFEKAMSGVQAATQASASVMGELRAAALKAGADTQYSATEAANAITEMAKAGVSAKDIMGGGLKGALNLAAAGQLNVADAAGIASVAMTQFGLKGAQLPHVADLLAAGAGKAMGSVGDLGAALNQAGLLASSTGISIETTTGTLAAFASAGLIGSDAGTSFKTMLQQLQAPSQQSAALMQQLGINAYDAQGNFIGLSALAQQLKDHLGGLTQAQRDNALAQIFGTDAARAANVLYREGADGIDKWTKKVNDAGYAQRQAAQLTDNLAGDLERLGGSFDTLLISLGQGLQGPLRGLTEMLGGITDAAGSAVQAFGELPGPMQAAILAALAWSVAGGKITGVYDAVSAKVRGFREEQELQRALFSMQTQGISDTDRALGGLGNELDTTGSKAGTARAALGGLARAIGPDLAIGVAVYGISALAAGIDTMAHAGEAAAKDVKDIDNSLRNMDSNAARVDAISSAIDDFRKKLDAANGTVNSTTGNVFKNLGDPTALLALGAGYKDASASASQYKKAVEDLEQRQQFAADATLQLSKLYGLTSDEVVQLADKYNIDLSAGIDHVSEKWVSSGAAADAAATGIATVGDTAGQTQGQIDAATKAMQDWINSMAQIGAAFVDPVSIYQGLLQTVAQSTADATKDSKDSWQDYADSAKVSLDEFAQHLQDQITAQENWHQNLVIVAQRAGYDVAAQLEQMGVQGAGLVAQMANSTDAEMQRMAGLLRQDATNGGAGAAQALDTQMKVMAAVGQQGANATIVGIADQLHIGTDVVYGISQKFGLNLASGINPLLAALGKTQVMIGGGGGRLAGQIAMNADGNLYESHHAQIAPGGAMRLWAEPETGGEAYIPLSPAKRARSVGIWQETGKRLGVMQFAAGGFMSPTDVPQPYSTAPYGPPLSSGGQAAMSTEFDAVTSWLRDFGGMVNYTPSAGVAQWAPLVLRVLGLLGQPAGLLNGVLSLIAHESGGNPNAINLTDSNARAGHPSQGLMQTIPGTFAAYAGPYRGLGITNPLANIYAGLNYGISRYGSIANIPGIASLARGGGYRPYAEGGVIGEPVIGVGLHSGDTYSFAERGPERVVPSGREMSGASFGRGGASSGSAGPMSVTLKLDGPATRELMEGHAVTAVIDYDNVRYWRGQHNG